MYNDMTNNGPGSRSLGDRYAGTLVPRVARQLPLQDRGLSWNTELFWEKSFSPTLWAKGGNCEQSPANAFHPILLRPALQGPPLPWLLLAGQKYGQFI